MKFPWQKKRQPACQAPPVVRPPSKTPISEFEAQLLHSKGVWLNIQIQVTPHGSWVNWKHNIPDHLRTEARDAIVALALKLQDDE